MRASILAIGTELTTGQITNRNAAWLSEKLAEIGIETVLHETVPDDRPLIREALERCHRLTPLIFVTGGLGPTTDDFTREVVAEWMGKPLQFHEASWTKINDRLGRLGVPVAPSNRQQTYYPETAQVIVNEQGTADAFACQIGECRLWVLPGPPREVEAVWHGGHDGKGGIEAQVRACVPHLTPVRLLTWQCVGKSEAELGELTERVLAGSGLKTGYRAHRPYVEIKVWCSDEDMRSKATVLDALDRALDPWIATRQGKDLAEILLVELARTDDVAILDACTGGVLAERLGVLLRKPAYATQANSIILSAEWSSPKVPLQWVQDALATADGESLTLAVAGFNEAGEWAFGLRDGAVARAEAGPMPYRRVEIPELRDRATRFAAEVALKRWCEWLESSTQ